MLLSLRLFWCLICGYRKSGFVTSMGMHTSGFNQLYMALLLKPFQQAGRNIHAKEEHSDRFGELLGVGSKHSLCFPAN
jgi:hypothetical protein